MLLRNIVEHVRYFNLREQVNDESMLLEFSNNYLEIPSSTYKIQNYNVNGFSVFLPERIWKLKTLRAYKLEVSRWF